MSEHATGVLVLKPGHQRALSILQQEIDAHVLQRKRYLEALVNEYELTDGTWTYDPQRNALVKQEQSYGMEP